MATILRPEYLTLNSLDVCINAFQFTSLAALLDDAPLEGDDRKIPHRTDAQRYIAHRRRRGRSVRTLPLFIDGRWKWDDTAHSDPRQGLIDNVEYLQANLGIAYAGNTSGLVTAVWHRPNASTKSAQVHVLGLIGGDKLGAITRTTTCDLSIPAGRFS